MMSLAARSCDLEGNNLTGPVEGARPKGMEFRTGGFYDTHLRYFPLLKSHKPGKYSLGVNFLSLAVLI